jgi:hypothetical protein
LTPRSFFIERGSAVRVRQRALQKRLNSALFVPTDLLRVERAGVGDGPLHVAAGRDARPARPTDETAIGREREHDPFVRVWRGVEPEGTERVRVSGRDATLVVWSPDYDGKGNAWVRFDDGTDAIVGGSGVER